MSKKILMLSLTVFMVTLILAIPVFAVDVNVDGTVTSTTVTFDVDDGAIHIRAEGIDTTHWHTGEVGNWNEFHGEGSFVGTYSVSQNQFGGLGVRINADASSWAVFTLDDYQDFNVLSGNHIYNVEGRFGAYAAGEGATINLKTAGSMYVWSEATNPWSADPIGGNEIGKYAYVEKDGVQQARLEIGVGTDGYATMDNSNIWGWGIWESGTASTHYNGGTRTISATGEGYFYQFGFGEDYLNFNGIELLGGGSMMTEG